ncbi:hypothetical protein NM688_g6145 [Phlebia brevispora]|uniref:Uncharacterized protein n=1 Tax=Phlebia brevispora TaxID=194682 RepID=A0ACC1SJM3_9APHY|nr:hypothetical protein NM688_g6145 [Phlebia brevispora]
MRFSFTLLTLFILALALHAASNKLLLNAKQRCEEALCESPNDRFAQDLVRELDGNIAAIKVVIADFNELLHLAQKLKQQALEAYPKARYDTSKARPRKQL